jgi:hypothetical protein
VTGLYHTAGENTSDFTLEILKIDGEIHVAERA